MIELVEGLLYRRYPQLSREEVLDMFHLTPLHKTRAWKQMNEESFERGKKVAQIEMVRNCIANGMSIKDTAKVTGLTATEVRRLAKPKTK